MERIVFMKLKRFLGGTVLCLGVIFGIVGIMAVTVPLIDNDQLHMILHSLNVQSRNPMVNTANGMALWILQYGYPLLGGGATLSLLGSFLLWASRKKPSTIYKQALTPGQSAYQVVNGDEPVDPLAGIDWRRPAHKPLLPKNDVMAIPQVAINGKPKSMPSQPAAPSYAPPAQKEQGNPYVAYERGIDSPLANPQAPEAFPIDTRHDSVISSQSTNVAKTDAYRPVQKPTTNVEPPSAAIRAEPVPEIMPEIAVTPQPVQTKDMSRGSPEAPPSAGYMSPPTLAPVPFHAYHQANHADAFTASEPLENSDTPLAHGKMEGSSPISSTSLADEKAVSVQFSMRRSVAHGPQAFETMNAKEADLLEPPPKVQYISQRIRTTIRKKHV